MSKTVSPITLRFKITPNYIHNIHLNKSFPLFKFFQFILNFLYLFKNKTYKPFKKKFLHIICNYYDFHNISLSVVCSKFFKKEHFLKTYSKIIKIFFYINYFIKFYLYKLNFFVWVRLNKLKKPNSSPLHLIHTITNFVKTGKYFKNNIVKFLGILLQTKSNIRGTLKGVKCICSGCLNRGGSKKKTYKYIKGDLPLSRLTANIVLTKQAVKTRKGIIGVQLWTHM